LKETKQALSIDIESLVEKKRHYESLINLDESLLKMKIEDRLRELKIENPELFFISNEEQIAMLVGNVLKWLIS
jgi:hypothetical protein